MAQVSAQLVKELREKTGAGMGDCKKALDETQGDIQAAIEILRKKGAASVAKRADRSANEGLVIALTSQDGHKAIIVEVNCETDFVARNAEFDNYAKQIANALLNNKVSSIEEAMETMADGKKLIDLHNEILAKFSEKIEIRRHEIIETRGFVADYIHAGNKLAVLVEVSAAALGESAYSKLRDVAMQIAAMNPAFVSRNQVDQVTLDKEKEIYMQQAVDSGKKPEIAEKIATGKLEKFYQENCLLEQTFVKDGNKTITDVMKEISAECGSEVSILSFRRYFLGESLS